MCKERKWFPFLPILRAAAACSWSIAKEFSHLFQNKKHTYKHHIPLNFFMNAKSWGEKKISSFSFSESNSSSGCAKSPYSAQTTANNVAQHFVCKWGETTRGWVYLLHICSEVLGPLLIEAAWCPVDSCMSRRFHLATNPSTESSCLKRKKKDWILC